MKEQTDPTPEGVFKLEELNTFRSLEGEQLADVNYYFWHNVATPQERFLLYMEILFVSENALILTSGEDSEALRVTEAMALIEEARQLMQRNGGTPAVRQLNASASALWKPLLGQPLTGIRLSKEETSGLYLNDALLLEFGETGVVVALSDKGGMAINQL